MTSPPRRRSRGRPGITTIFWRDIPAQITTTGADGDTEKVLLESRFQLAIDRAAHVAGLTDTNDYVAQWRRVERVAYGNPGEPAQATADAIHTEYPHDRLEALVASGGLAPEPVQGLNSEKK